MKCPHCTTDFHHDERFVPVDKDSDGSWGLGVCRCSKCQKLVIRLISAEGYDGTFQQFEAESTSMLVRPKVAGRPPIPPEVPGKYAEDYREACLVLADSAKASAALVVDAFSSFCVMKPR
jgi:hypothetical protein